VCINDGSRDKTLRYLIKHHQRNPSSLQLATHHNSSQKKIEKYFLIALKLNEQKHIKIDF
jgi:hypothetical protein